MMHIKALRLIYLFKVINVPESIFLSGKREIRRLNNHDVVVILPDNPMPYEEGVRKMESLVDKIMKRPKTVS